MKTKSRFALLLVTLGLVAATGLLAATACSTSRAPAQTGPMTDAEYISIASKTVEAQTLLAEFPQAEATVDHSGALAVDYRVSRLPTRGADQTWQALRLRVLIDADQHPSETLVECNGKLIGEGIVAYVENYAETQTCR